MKARQFFFAMVAILILSFGGIIGAFYIGNRTLETKANEIGTLLADRDISQEKILRLQKARRDTEELESVVKLLNRLLPSEKEQDKLIADIIYTATAEAGIPFNQVKAFSFSGSSEADILSGTEPSKTNPGVYEYPFNLQIEKITYDTLLKLLTEIEHNGRIVQVANIQISPDAANPNFVSVTLSTKAYLKP